MIIMLTLIAKIILSPLVYVVDFMIALRFGGFYVPRSTSVSQGVYTGQVFVSVFDSVNLRWVGYFKTQKDALLAARIKAFKLDWFGDVSYECGIHWVVEGVEVFSHRQTMGYRKSFTIPQDEWFCEVEYN